MWFLPSQFGPYLTLASPIWLLRIGYLSSSPFWHECHFTRWNEAGEHVTALAFPPKPEVNCVTARGRHPGLPRALWQCTSVTPPPCSVSPQLLLREFCEELIRSLSKKRLVLFHSIMKLISLILMLGFHLRFTNHISFCLYHVSQGNYQKKKKSL